MEAEATRIWHRHWAKKQNAERWKPCSAVAVGSSEMVSAVLHIRMLVVFTVVGEDWGYSRAMSSTGIPIWVQQEGHFNRRRFPLQTCWVIPKVTQMSFLPAATTNKKTKRKKRCHDGRQQAQAAFRGCAHLLQPLSGQCHTDEAN